MSPYDFATGNTNPETFPAAEFAEVANRVIQEIAVDLNRYPGKLGFSIYFSTIVAVGVLGALAAWRLQAIVAARRARDVPRTATGL